MDGPLHGYAIARNLHLQSGETLDIEFGSIYKLTAAGRKRLRSEHSKWTDFVRAVTRVMGPEGAGK